MIEIFLNVVAPIFIMASLGAVLAKWKKVAAPPLSNATLFVFSPALIFNSLYKSQLPVELSFRILVFVALLATSLYLLSWVIARLGRFESTMESAFLLSTLFMNSGNYGIPVALLAFGQEGLERAALFFVVQAVLGTTLGVYLASRSQAVGASAFLEVLKMPMVYAAVAALSLNLLHITPPQVLLRPMEIMGAAAIPSMLLVLGIQLAGGMVRENYPAVTAASLIRLVISGGLAFGLTSLLGISGVTQQVLIVLASMPTAVFPIILATSFNARPQFVTSVVLVSTLSSLLTLTGLITFLKSVALG